MTVTGGARYTDDDKDLSSASRPDRRPDRPRQTVADDQVSWDLAALYEVSDDLNVYGRLASGFRAPTSRAATSPSSARRRSPTRRLSRRSKLGFKSQLADDRVRLNAAVFYYEIEDQQLSAIGGGGNFVQLVNADKGTGMGIDLDGEFLITDRFMMTLGLSYTDTEIEDDELVVPPCGSGMCTVLDPLDVDGNAIIDGNSFVQAPEYVATVTARYGIPIGTTASCSSTRTGRSRARRSSSSTSRKSSRATATSRAARASATRTTAASGKSRCSAGTSPTKRTSRAPSTSTT